MVLAIKIVPFKLFKQHKQNMGFLNIFLGGICTIFISYIIVRIAYNSIKQFKRREIGGIAPKRSDNWRFALSFGIIKSRPFYPFRLLSWGLQQNWCVSDTLSYPLDDSHHPPFSLTPRFLSLFRKKSQKHE